MICLARAAGGPLLTTMKKTAAKSHVPGPCEEALRDLLLATAGPDNLDAFLRKILKSLSGHKALGGGLGLVLAQSKGAPPLILGSNLTEDELRLLAGGGGARSKHFKEFLAAPIKSGAAKGCLLARPGPEDRHCAGQLLALAAKTVSGRLEREDRDRLLSDERDLADAIAHMEELYLNFPDLSVKEISRIVLDEACRLTRSAFGFAGYISRETGALHVPAFNYAGRAHPGAEGSIVIFRKFTGLWGWVLKNKKPLLTNSAASDPRAADLVAGHAATERFAAAPAISGKELLGIISLANPPHDYPPSVLAALVKLARTYALMISAKTAEQQRAAESDKYEAIVDASQDLTYNLNTDGILTFVSRQAENYGYKPREVIGRHFSDFIHPLDRARAKKSFLNALKSDSPPPPLSYRLLKKDGSFANVEQKSSLLRRPGAAPLLMGAMRDRTGDLRSEESDRKYKTLFDAANTAIIIADAATGEVLDANKYAETLTGRARKELIGMDRLKLHPPEDSKLYRKQFIEHAGVDSASLAKAEILRKDGSRVPVRISASTLTLNGRKVLQGIFYDVSALLLAEDKYRALVESTDTGYLILDSRGRVTDANKEYLRLTGRHRMAEILGRPVTEWTAPHDRERNRLEVEKCLKHGFARNLTLDYTDGRGNFTPVEINATVLKTANSFQIISLCRDITDRRLAEKRLSESEDKYRRLVENLAKEYFFYQHNTKGVFTYVSRSMTRMLGYSQKQFLAHFRKYLTPDPINKAVARHSRLSLRGIQQPPYYVEIYHKNGSPLRLEVSETPVRGTAGKVIAVEGIAKNVTVRQRVEDALRQSEALLRLTLAQFNGVFWVLDRNLRFIISRGQGLAGLGLKPDEVVGLTLQEFMRPTGADNKSIPAHRRALRGENVSYAEHFGDYIFDIILSPLKDASGRITGVVGAGLNTTERSALENKLRTSEETLAKIFDNTAEAIFLKDHDDRYLKANKACAELFLRSQEEMIGRTTLEVFGKEIAEAMRKDDEETLRQGKTVLFAREYETPAGKVYIGTSRTPLRGPDGEITCILGVARDLTAMKKMESEAALAKASDAMSKAAAPLAHDFNNALSAIIGYATLIDDEMSDSDPAKKEIGQIIKAVNRAAEITAKLQSFAQNPGLGGQEDKKD